MKKQDPRIDAYIQKSAEFAKPILLLIRKTVHKYCPEASETIKWSFPHFEYKGSILCSMASFKQHCAFGFWLGSEMKDPHGLLSPVGERTSMGHFGKLTSLKDLPNDKILAFYIKQAMELIDSGVKMSKTPKVVSKQIEVPKEFTVALNKNKKAKTFFDSLSPSNKKDYTSWIAEAKTDTTRQKRILTSIEWLEEGKVRNWKYIK